MAEDAEALLPEFEGGQGAGGERGVGDGGGSSRQAAARTPWQLMRLHLALLVWKNGVLQKRRPISTCCEILLPVLSVLILVGIRAATLVLDHDERCVRPMPRDVSLSDAKVTYYDNCDWTSFSSASAPPRLAHSTYPEETCASAAGKWHIGWVGPNAAETVMQNMTHIFGEAQNITNPIWLQRYNSEDELVQRLVPSEFTPEEANYTCVMGVIFQALDLESRTASYTLRLDSTPGYWYAAPSTSQEEQHNKGSWFTDRSFPALVLSVGPRIEQPTTIAMLPKQFNRYGASPGYAQYMFVPAQSAVNQALFRNFRLSENATKNATAELRGVRLRRFPFPAYRDNTFAIVIKSVLPLFLVLSLLFTAISISKSVVDEKESRLTETFKMMGITAATQWLAWFLQYIFFLSISVSLVVFCLKIGQVLVHSDWSLLWVFLMLFASASIALMFIVSVFFTQASTAAAVAGLVWFISYLPYRFMTPRWSLLTAADKSAACLLSTTCMSIGANVIGELEGAGIGVTWENLYNPISADDNFTFGTVLNMLLLDTLLYWCLVLYLDAVIPSELGVPKPWHFIFHAQWWQNLFGELFDRDMQPKLSISAEDIEDAEPVNQEDLDRFEPGEEDAVYGVELRNLRKTFFVYETDSNQKKQFWSGKVEKVAVVGNRSLRLQQGRITALLGHNGAGKTTTMSMLCGLIPPSGGTAIIDGKYDICKDLRVAQSRLGLCPQHNTLISSLTVYEHLWLFAKLKGMSDKHVYRAIDEMVHAIELLDKRHHTVQTLSGGMKRKLSCALALVGDSPVVILDEPTSGCDPSARRAIWDLLLTYRSGRTMLLSTHHMDEADILGDRVAIMVEGRIECCGSPLFLKSRYGIGYRLSLVVQADCNVDRLSHTILSIVPDAVLANKVFSDLSYTLPRESTTLFPKLFEILEKEKSELGIESFGVAGASIEDVFLKVGDGSDELAAAALTSADGDIEMIDMDAGASESSNHRSSMGNHLRAHFRAMFMKRSLDRLRNRWAIVPQLLVPSAFVLFALVIAKTYPSPQSLPERNLNDMTSHYGDNTVVLSDASIGPKLMMQSGQNVKGLPADTTNMSWGLLQYACNQFSIDGPMSACAAPDIATFNSHTLVAIDKNVSQRLWTAWFNGQAYHSIAESFALTSNAILNSYSQFRGKITTINHPLPRTPSERLESDSDSGLGVSVAIMVMIGMSFLVSYFVIFPVVERASKAKRMQLLSGVHLGVFWGVSFVFDFVNFLVPSVLNIILFAIFAIPSYAGPQLQYVVLLFILYGFAVIPIMYVGSFAFNDGATAYSRAVLYNVVTGLVGVLAIFILSTTDADLATTVKTWLLVFPNFCFGQAFVEMYTNHLTKEALGEINRQYVQNIPLLRGQVETNLEFLCSLVGQDSPIYPICSLVLPKIYTLPSELTCSNIGEVQSICGEVQSELQRLQSELQRLPSIPPNVTSYFNNVTSYFNIPVGGLAFNCEDNYAAMAYPGIGKYLLSLFLQAICYLVLLGVIELNLLPYIVRNVAECLELNSLFEPPPRTESASATDEDDDVSAERQRVNNENGDSTNDIVTLHELTKVYKLPWCSGEVEAVNQLSIGIAKGSCFGLLGVNGAGKTSTFKMLTGDEKITNGRALMNGYDAATNMNAARRFIGYAPQFDALINLMTGRELISMFAMLRGVPQNAIADQVQQLIFALSLERHADRICKNYSGGNKRKLSTAMALVGDPPIVLLDEPTSGLDPVARRALWQALERAMVEKHQTIILTSHSMEECDALCSTMAIMVNGEFRCYGTPQHLKSKFGKGSSITVSATNRERALEHMRKIFPRCALTDDHSSSFKITLENDSSLADLFMGMERARSEGVVADYSISQTTLEEVFIRFARDQTESEVREEAYRQR